jgi:hypothetical protein
MEMTAMKRILLLTLLALLALLIASPIHAAVAFVQPHDGGGALHKSSWYPPDGLDGDAYCWDDFTLPSNRAITEVHWRGGYEFHPSGSGQSAVSDFEVSIYRSIPAGTQPDVGAGGRLVHYFVGGNAGETPAGAFGGVQMFDYAFTLPSPFQATGGVKYWVQVEASQGAAAPSYAPDWGFAVGTGGNNAHFRRITGGTYQAPLQDLAFSLNASDAATVTITASESPAGAGTITGAGAYPVGSTVSLMATANAGFGFVNWTENGTPVRNQPGYTFTASADRTLVANFVPTFTITVSAFPAYGGTVTGGGVYNDGATVNLAATANPGFVFTTWSDSDPEANRSFPAASDLDLVAYFDNAPGAVTYDFDSAPVHSSFPLDLTVNGLTAHFTGGYSIQPAGTLGFTPLGFAGLCVYPNSVFASDLGVSFPEALTDFSILYAVDELGCDTSARMRVTAYLAGAQVGTNTMVAPVPGTYPSATLAISVPGGFNSVVVHWDAAGTGCQDYGPIFLADNVTVTRATALVGASTGGTSGVARLAAPAPSPFHGATMVRYFLPRAGDARLDVLTWDGTDAAGRQVGAGMYYLRLEGAGSVHSRRVVFLR